VAVELAEDGGEGRENKGEEEGADDGTRFSPCMEQHHGGGEGGADEHKQTDDAVTPREDVGGTTIGDADEVVVMQHGPFDVLLEVGGRDRARQHTPRGHEGKLVAVGLVRVAEGEGGEGSEDRGRDDDKQRVVAGEIVVVGEIVDEEGIRENHVAADFV